MCVCVCRVGQPVTSRESYTHSGLEMAMFVGGGMVIFENDQTGKPKLRTLWKLSTGHYDTYGTLGYGPRHEFYLFSENIFLHQRTRWCDALGWVIGSSIPYHVDSK